MKVLFELCSSIEYMFIVKFYIMLQNNYSFTVLIYFLKKCGIIYVLFEVVGVGISGDDGVFHKFYVANESFDYL